MIFGDNPSGQIFYVDADKLPNGGQAAVRQILFNDKGTRKTLLQLIGEKNTQQKKGAGRRAPTCASARAPRQIFVLNKRDGVIRLFVPDSTEGLRPSDSPTRALTRRFVGALLLRWLARSLP